MKLLQLSLVAAVYLRGELNELAAAGAGQDPNATTVAAVYGTTPDPGPAWTNVTADPPVTTPTPPPPSAADEAGVGQPMAPAHDHIEDPKYVAALHSAFVLQFVHTQQDAMNNEQARDALDPSEDFCLEVGEPDELGGTGLKFGHCQHQDMNPGPTPLEQQWFLMPDGKIAAAGNTSHPRCLSKRQCRGATVYDLHDCYGMASQAFSMSATHAGRIDDLRKVGPPINGVVGPGRLHGPFQLYESCDGVEMPEGCVQIKPRAGWTKLTTQYLGPMHYEHGEDDQEWVKTAAQVVQGDFAGAVDAVTADGLHAAEEAAGLSMGLARSDLGEAQCGTKLTENDRAASWWYLIRLTEA